MSDFWTSRQIPFTNSEACRTGTTFTAHRGAAFVSTISITTQKNLNFKVSMKEDCSCRIQVGDDETPAFVRLPRIFKIVWFNAAQPAPHIPGSRFPFKDYLLYVINHIEPDVFFFSCTGYAYKRVEIQFLITRLLGLRLFYQVDLGKDGGSFALCGRGNGTATQDEDYGFDIASGVEFTYTWN